MKKIGYLVFILIILSVFPNGAYAWWSPSWQYRKGITVSSSSALTDYQVLINLDTQGLISTGKMRSDCGDIRFVDADDLTQLKYWLESGCNSASTRLWVKVPSIPSGTKTIYMYYGNPSAPVASNLTATMIVLSSNPSFTTYGSWYPATNNIQENPGNTLTPDGVYGDMRTTDSWAGQDEGCYWRFDFGSSASRSFYVKWYNSVTKVGSYCVDFTTTISVSPDGSSWTTVTSNKLTATGQSSVFTTNSNGTYRYVKVDQYSTTACMTGPGYTYVDAVYARKYVSPEPTTSVESEESIPTTTTTVTTTTSTTTTTTSTTTTTVPPTAILRPGTANFSTSAIFFDILPGTNKTIGLTGNRSYLNMYWEAYYSDGSSRDIGAVCFLNCDERYSATCPGPLNCSCPAVQNCSTFTLPGKGVCSVLSPNYKSPLSISNFVSCRFYDPLDPNTTKGYLNSEFAPINFSVWFSDYSSIVGEEFNFPVNIKNQGLFTDTFNGKAWTNRGDVVKINPQTQSFVVQLHGDAFEPHIWQQLGPEIEEIDIKVTLLDASAGSTNLCIDINSSMESSAFWSGCKEIKSKFKSLPELSLIGLVSVMLVAAIFIFRFKKRF